MKGKGSRFPSALIGYNIEVTKGLSGTTLYPNIEKVVEDGYIATNKKKD